MADRSDTKERARCAVAAWSWRTRVLGASRRIFEETVRELDGANVTVEWERPGRPCVPRFTGGNDSGRRPQPPGGAADGRIAVIDAAERPTISGGMFTAEHELSKSPSSPQCFADGADDPIKAASYEEKTVRHVDAKCGPDVMHRNVSTQCVDASSPSAPGPNTYHDEHHECGVTGQDTPETIFVRDAASEDQRRLPEEADTLEDKAATQRSIIEEELRLTRELIAERLKVLRIGSEQCMNAEYV